MLVIQNKMKVLYGVQGAGNTPIANARIMENAFSQRSDIDVDFVFSGRSINTYEDMASFSNARFFRGLDIPSHSQQPRVLKTLNDIKNNQVLCNIKQLDVSQYDLVLNDAEPISAWAAKLKGIPSISIGHQAAFNYRVPKVKNYVSRRLMSHWLAPTNIQLGMHWFHFNQPIVPPFVSNQAVYESSNYNYIAVYLPFESVNNIQVLLEPLSDQRFICYHPHIKSNVERENVSWRSLHINDTEENIQNCAGVITNGDFNWVSKALQLGKKLLIKPAVGQFESLSDLRVLEKLELCHTLYHLDTDDVEEWLAHDANEPISFPDDPTPLIDWLLKRQWDNAKPLTDHLWQQVYFPDKTKQRLLSLAF